MRKHWKTLITTAAALAALAGGPAWYAYADTPSSQGSGGMMQDGQGDMMGMMNMMGQMNQMMEACNNMMKGMAQDHGPGTPKKKSPENKD